MIKKKIRSLLVVVTVMITQIVFSQEMQVNGLVSNNGSPLPGVTILIKGTYSGTETDFDGNYSIKVEKGQSLIYSFIGMVTVEKKVGDENVMNVSLEDDRNILNEVIVVATGYDNIKKTSFTGAASTIQAEDLKIDGIVDVTRMLEGKVAGVSIQNISGTFGSAPKVTIRGSSSVFGNNTPLYVIDGVVQEDIIEQDLDELTSGDASTLIGSSIAGINASDIKKIDVLKDASATSIYGARARNGVIVITTKSGSRNSPLKVSYNLEQTIREIPSYNSFDVVNSKENIGVLRELFRDEAGFTQITNSLQGRYGGVYHIMYDRINTFDTSTGSFLLENTPEARGEFLQQYELANTDWFDELFRYNVVQNHSLSLSGGGENNAYYASVSLLDDAGRTIADRTSRITANLKNTFYLSDKFQATMSSNVAVRKQKAPGTFERETDVVNGEVSRDFDINPFSYALNTSRTLRPRDNEGNLEYYRNNWADFNILNELKNNFIDLNQIDVRLQLDTQYKISDHITYDFNGSIRYVNNVTEHSIKENSNVVGAYNAAETTIVRNANIFLYQDPSDSNATPVAVLPNGGIYIKNTDNLTSYYVRNSLKYDNVFNGKHNLNILLGQDLRYVDRDSDEFIGYGLQFDNGLTPFTDARIIDKLVSQGDDYFSLDKERERTVAFFGKATYSYDDKYVFSVTGRYDGSNKQGASSSSRWLPTGSVSGKWNAKNENFLINSNTISNLSFRTSYGLVATPGSATNALSILLNEITDRFLPEDRENYINIDELQNADLTWEKQYEFNLGFDLGLFNNRVNLSTDVYRRDIFDNIDFVRTGGIDGQVVKQGNNSDAVTKGIEFMLQTKNINSNDFKWSTTFNFSAFDQEITKLESTPNALNATDETGSNLEGYPIDALFSFNFAGLDSRGIPQFMNSDGEVSGFVNFQETENLDDYLVYEGSVNPNISGGITNNFTYKNWNLNVLVTGSGGNKIRLNPIYSAQYSDVDTFSKDIVNRWLLPGDENITNIPKIITLAQEDRDSGLERTYNAYNYSTERVADGSFVRMKTISLGYSFNNDLIEKLGLSHLRMQLQGTNLFLIYSDDKLNGQDPEFFQSGGVALPITTQYTFSLNLGF